MIVAEQSPRLVKDGSLRWYYGDTFILTFVFTLKDVDGNIIAAKPTDEIEVVFKDFRNVTIARFTSKGTNKIDMNIDKETSNRFIEGAYTITTRFNGGFVTTLLKNNKVVVE